MDTQSLVAKLRQKHSKLSSGGGGGVNFVKFDAGKNRFRLVKPNPETYPMIIFYKRHRGKRHNGRFFAPVDLNWLLKDADCREEMLRRGKITDKDIDMIQRYGDPYSTLYKALESLDRAKSYTKSNIGQKRSLMLVFFNGDFGALDMGIGFGETMLGSLEDNPIIIDWEKGYDFSSEKKVGKHWRDTEYTSPTIILDSQGPLDFEVSDSDGKPNTPNLYDVIEMNTLTYPEKVAFLLRSHEKLADMAALNIDDFGVTEEELTAIFQAEETKEKKKKDFPHSDNNKDDEEEEEIYEEDEEDNEEEEEVYEEDDEENDNEEKEEEIVKPKRSLRKRSLSRR